VQAAIMAMEDDPAFDAGYGSVLNREGIVEMDASIMDGRTLDVGAVAGIQHVKNVIVLARRVMESEHTFLIGRGAEQFAQAHNLTLVENETLRAPAAIAEWQKFCANPPAPHLARYVEPKGTVGCVAVDHTGNIVAGTSTGGMAFKPAGRVGDSPIIGAGTYADDMLGGASSTGWGEAITRVVMAKFAVDALANDRTPNDAAHAAIEYLARRVGGTGGIILADRLGRVGLAFNTPKMARAWITEQNEEITAIC
jgi:beta-aspartyl-peptidase (threonine type)